MTSGSRSSPAITSAGSPGSNCCSEKIRIETKNSVGINWTTRRARKFSMARSRVRQHSLQLQPDHAHQPGRHLLVAFELVGMREQESPVIDVEQRLLLKYDLGQFLIDRLALCLVGDKAAVVERLVGLLIGPGAVVLRRVGLLEDVGIAVRIDPSTPGQQV